MGTASFLCLFCVFFVQTQFLQKPRAVFAVQTEFLQKPRAVFIVHRIKWLQPHAVLLVRMKFLQKPLAVESVQAKSQEKRNTICASTTLSNRSTTLRERLEQTRTHASDCGSSAETAVESEAVNVFKVAACRDSACKARDFHSA